METQLSFLNQLASRLTFGIYTPMSISVQCAAAGTALNGAELSVPANAIAEQAPEVMTRAVEVSAEDEQPIIVRFLAE